MAFAKKLAARAREQGLWRYLLSTPLRLARKLLRAIRWDYPSFLTRFGVGKRAWERTQVEHELHFWQHIEAIEKLDGHATYREKYFRINSSMFVDLRMDFPGGTVVDVGCGPELGFLPFARARTKIAVEPLADEYRKTYTFDDDVVVLAAPGEQIPLLTGSVDAVYCVNALDHMRRPYRALDEIWRILKPGGYLALSVDVGGTPGHPVKIMEKDVDAWIGRHDVRVIERECSLEKPSSWSKEARIPLFVFQGIKNA
jgi:SAM-dependent methyltransferase